MLKVRTGSCLLAFYSGSTIDKQIHITILFHVEFAAHTYFYINI